jgi:hypothetical protein
LFTVYMASLHFAVMTLTTVGYGDIVPYSDAEYVVCVTIMLLGGMFWAYVIGGLCEIATTMDPQGTEYKKIMGDLNFMMDDHGMPKPMQCEIRRYWKSSQHLQRLNSYGELTDKLSPALKGKVAWSANKWWLTKVWYFAEIINADEDGDGDPDPEFFEELMGYKLPTAVGQACEVAMDFVSEIARGVKFHMFAPGERMPGPPSALCVIVNRGGLVGRQGRMLRHGSVWGYDVLLVRDPKMAELASAGIVMMLTFVEVGRLDRTEFEEVLTAGGDRGEGFPAMQNQMRRARAWITLKAFFLALRQTHAETGMFPWELVARRKEQQKVTGNQVAYLENDGGKASRGAKALMPARSAAQDADADAAHRQEIDALRAEADRLRVMLDAQRRREVADARKAVRSLQDQVGLRRAEGDAPPKFPRNSTASSRNASSMPRGFGGSRDEPRLPTYLLPRTDRRAAQSGYDASDQGSEAGSGRIDGSKRRGVGRASAPELV